MSLSSHMGRIQTFRDDLESLFYTLLYLQCGFLAWTDISSKEPFYDARIAMLKSNWYVDHQQQVTTILDMFEKDYDVFSIDTFQSIMVTIDTEMKDE